MSEELDYEAIQQEIDKLREEIEKNQDRFGLVSIEIPKADREIVGDGFHVFEVN